MTKKITVLIFVFLTAAFFGFIGYFYIAQDNFFKDFLRRYGKADVSGIKSGELKDATPEEEMVKVPIFVYHSVLPYYPSESEHQKKFDVKPDVFETQMRYLKENGYSVISFYDLISHFSQNLSLPEKPVILTFDDAWENQYKYAFPILKKYNYTATFFVFTNAISHDRFLTWDEARELVSAGMTIGNHSKSHPYLFKITDKNELYKEIVGSKNILENKLGKKIDIFAYPFGLYNDEIIKMLKENGFKAARTDGYYDVFHNKNELFTLKSIEAENDLIKFITALNIMKK